MQLLFGFTCQPSLFLQTLQLEVDALTQEGQLDIALERVKQFQSRYMEQKKKTKGSSNSSEADALLEGTLLLLKASIITSKVIESYHPRHLNVTYYMSR